MDLTIFAFSNTDARSLRSLSNESVPLYDAGRLFFLPSVSRKMGMLGCLGPVGVLCVQEEKLLTD